MSQLSSSRAWSILRHVLPVAGLIGVFCLAFFGEQGLMANHRLRQEMLGLRGEIDELQSANAALEEEIRRLREDPDAIEATIREEMLMVRDGEVVYAFEDGEPGTPAEDPDATDGTGER